MRNLYRRNPTNISMLVVLSIFLLSSFVVSASAKEMAKAMAPVPGMVNTVLGPMPAEKLGMTLMHEHFVFAYPGWFADATIAPDNYKEIPVSYTHLRAHETRHDLVCRLLL